MTTTTFPSPSPARPILHYTPLFVSFIVAIAYAVPMGILSVAWEQMRTDLNQPLESLGILLTAGLIGRVSMTLFGGQVLARLGIWRCMIIGVSGMTIGFLAYIAAPSWEVLLFAVLIAAIGNGVMDIGLTLAVVARYRAGMLNWMHAIFGVGLIIGPLLFTYVNDMGWGWRTAYISPLILVVIGLIIVLLTRSEWTLPSQRNTDGTENTQNVSVFATLRQPVVWLWVCIAFIYGGIEVGVGQLSNGMLVSERGLTIETAAYWLSLFGLAFTIGRMVSSFLMRYPPQLLLRGYAAGTVIGALVMLIPTQTAALLGLLILGSAMAGFFPTQLAMLPARVGDKHAPNAIGFTISAVSVGVTVLPGLGAVLAANSGFGIVPAFFLAMSLALLAITFAVRSTPSQSS